MPLLPVWDETEHVDIVSHPLKGEYVQILAQALRDSASSYSPLINDAATANPAMADSLSVFSRINGVMEKYLSNPAAAKHGIDFHDFQTIVYQCCTNPAFTPEEAVRLVHEIPV